MGWTAVIDIGKTHAKATLWDTAANLVASRSRANRTPAASGIWGLDVSGIEHWLVGVLTEFAASGPVDAVIPVAHGAAAALIHEGRLLREPLDYEWTAIASDRRTYDAERDPFAVTGSPPLPRGLNLGLQLHWLDSQRNTTLGNAQIVPWPQFWGWRLSEVAASEVTSLGCHTDLWRHEGRGPSNLSMQRGWAERLAPLRPANAVLGTITSEWVQRTGLAASTRVLCGLHDSNAALFGLRARPEFLNRDTTVLSTGTWFIAMRSTVGHVADTIAHLPEARDCLVNVDVTGAPVPSARFMGGREIEVLTHAQWGAAPAGAEAALQTALRAIECGAMILPSAVPGVGPFPRGKHRRTGPPLPDDHSTVLSFLYAALVADVSLDLIGSRDSLIIDGRFSQSALFTRALATLRPHTQVYIDHGEHGVARGALRLLDRLPVKVEPLQPVERLPIDMGAYRMRWREAAENGEYSS
jgi:sugar (pentulose or hexulose) kinase